MKLLTKSVLSNLLAQFKNIFGLKSVLDKNIEDRRQYLLEIDYEKELAFNIDYIIGEDAAPYVGQAVVGNTFVA